MDWRMKDFIYTEDETNLHAYACRWLDDMGLKETRWILDSEWFIAFYKNRITFNKWINE